MGEVGTKGQELIILDVRNIFAKSHTKYQWSCSYCLEPGRRRGEKGDGGGGERDWGFCGVVGFPTDWHLHFVSFTGRSSEPFCLVELLYKSWGGVQKYRLQTAIMGLNLGW